VPPFLWRWWHQIQVFIITQFYFVNWKVAHNCLLRLIRVGMESIWLHFFFLIIWGSRVWQLNMTVFIAHTRTPLIPLNWNTKQLFHQTQHFNAIQHTATCLLPSGHVCYERLRKISPYATCSFFLSYSSLIRNYLGASTVDAVVSDTDICYGRSVSLNVIN
jgi:hypothetical protein